MLRTILPAFLFGWVFLSGAHAGDWPQWGGPDRNFTASGVELADRWPSSGPRQLWSRKLGVGYSGIVAADGMLYTMYRKSRTAEVEYAVALEAITGETIWEFEHAAPQVGPPAEPSDSRWGGQGPNATPLIVGDRLYTMGSRAVMHCHNRKTGRVLWKRDLAEEYGATYAGRKDNDIGYSSSPIAYGNSVIVLLGRSRVKEVEAGQSLVALDRTDGRVLWKSCDFKAGYSSPILIRIGEQDQLVMHVKSKLIGVDPSDGSKLWTAPLDGTWESIVTPVWDGENGVLVIDSENARRIELRVEEGRATARRGWSSDRMQVKLPTPVLAGGTFFGCTKGMLVAVEVSSGEHLWTERGYPSASLIHADGKLLLLDENGRLTLAKPSPKGLEVLSRSGVMDKYSLTAPALVDTKLFIRDRERIVALDLS